MVVVVGGGRVRQENNTECGVALLALGRLTVGEGVL